MTGALIQPRPRPLTPVMPRMRPAGQKPDRSSLHYGLVAWWELDELSGIRFDRVSGNHLTDNNTVGRAVGVLGVGHAGQFVRADGEYLSIADGQPLSMGGDVPLTISAWVYMDSKPAAAMVIAGKVVAATSNYEYGMLWNQATDRMRMFASSNGSTISSVDADSLGSPALATWHHVIGWHDPVVDTMNIQVNAGGVNRAAHTGGIYDGTAPFEIGRYNADANRCWDGRICRVGLWKRVLSAGERAELWNGGIGLSWPFERAG